MQWGWGCNLSVEYDFSIVILCALYSLSYVHKCSGHTNLFCLVGAHTFHSVLLYYLCDVIIVNKLMCVYMIASNDWVLFNFWNKFSVLYILPLTSYIQELWDDTIFRLLSGLSGGFFDPEHVCGHISTFWKPLFACLCYRININSLNYY